LAGKDEATMKSRKPPLFLFALCTALLSPVWLAAQSANSEHKEHSGNQSRYKLVDLGTLGGPHSYGEINGNGIPLLNNSGIVVPYAPGH
jgi:hypothetical protein